MPALSLPQGATDALAHVLGQSRVQLGMNTWPPPLCVHATKGAEDVVLYFGIIDILQVGGCWQWRWRG